MEKSREQRLEAVDRMLDEVMVKHFEMASLIGEYRDLLADLEERPWDRDKRRLARVLPGAKYHVSATFVREHVKRIEGELGVLIPEEEG